MYWQPLGGALFAPPPPLCPVMLANTVYAIHALVYADVATKRLVTARSRHKLITRRRVDLMHDRGSE